MPATVHLWSEPRLQEFAEIFPRQDEQVHSTVLDGESVLLNLNSGAITRSMSSDQPFGICAGEQSLRQIHSAICARFDVSEQQAQDDMLALIVLLEQEGLLHTERR